MDTELKNRLLLYYQSRIGLKTYRQLLKILEVFETDLQQLFAEPKQLKEIFNNPVIHQYLSKRQIQAIKRAVLEPDTKKLEQDSQWLEQSENHYIISCDDIDYPPQLKQIENCPMILYVMGQKQLLKKQQIAMVGTRLPSAGGKENARQFAYYLAQNGIIITSGMAQGIDTICHQAALDAGGFTIAVSGTGIDRVYPAKNRKLAHQIVENGVIVSQFPQGTGPLRENFPMRNVVISGLSAGTLVVEAAVKSGSLITARQAMEQGREVFAIPGSIHHPLTRGCHLLIKQGAKLVETADDILEELQASIRLDKTETYKKPNTTIADNTHENTLADGNIKKNLCKQDCIGENDIKEQKVQLTAIQKKILHFLGSDPTTIDKLQLSCGIDTGTLNHEIILLEMGNHIRQLADGKIEKL